MDINTVSSENSTVESQMEQLQSMVFPVLFKKSRKCQSLCYIALLFNMPTLHIQIMRTAGDKKKCWFAFDRLYCYEYL